MEKISIDQQLQGYERMEIQGKIFRVPCPDRIPEFKFVGREDIIEKAMTAWASFDRSAPLNFRLYGPPGVGKNAIVYELARVLKNDIYTISGDEELTSEDIACTPVITSGNIIEYSASPLFAAILRGGIGFFDEIGKARTGALSPLASLLDERRTLTSVLAGIRIKASEEFLFCCALNDTEEGLRLPSFLDERTRPAIYVGYPPLGELKCILESHFLANNPWVTVFISEFKDAGLSPRIAINLIRYARRVFKEKGEGSVEPTEREIKDCFYSLLKDVCSYDNHAIPVNKMAGEDKDALFTSDYRKTSVH